MTIQAKQALSLALALFSSIGTVATAYFAIKDSKKAEKKKADILKENPETTDINVIRATIPCYGRTIAIGAATIASTVGSIILNRKAEVSLIAGATLLQQGYTRYSGKVKSMLGMDAHKNILENLANEDARKSGIDTHDPEFGDGKELYWVENIGYFRAKPEDLMRAYADMNQRLHTVDKKGKTAYFCLIYDMIKDAKADILDEERVSLSNFRYGWTRDYLEDISDSIWIHMNLIPSETEDGVEYKLITFDEDPIEDASNMGLDYMEYDKDPSTFKSVEIKEQK